MTTTAAPPPIIPITYDPNCDDSSLIRWIDETCLPIDKAHNDAAAKISGYTETNTTNSAKLLLVYYASITRSNSSSSNKDLSVAVIDKSVGKLNDLVVISSSASFIMSIRPNDYDDRPVGAFFQSKSGGATIFDSNLNNSLNMSFSAAAVFDNHSLTNIANLNLLLLEKPNGIRLFNDLMNRTVVSSVIVANPRRTNNYSIDIQLYFTNPVNYGINITDGNFLCVYFDTETLTWNKNGCTTPNYNSTFDRYECICNHLTSFGLIWLPSGSSDPTLRAVDIASLVFQFFSIVCFVLLIIHSIVNRRLKPYRKLQSTQLLPLISCASTALLFIFYIALTLTVYTKAKSLETNVCFTSATTLMFFVYFLLFFMFCTKTSIGYFNYIYFVRLFPPPSFKKLLILLLISLVISIIAVAFGVAFNSKSASGIIAIYSKKICWFDKNVIYYFMTIPIGIFLLINCYLLIRTVERMINHARNATSSHQSYQLMKECVLVSVFSSISQGIAWIIGPFLIILDSRTGMVFEWVFVICNALEGVWSILLYIIIQKLLANNEEKPGTAANSHMKTKGFTIKRDKQINSVKDRIKGNSKWPKCQVIYRSPRKDSYWLNNVSNKMTLDISTSEYYA